MPCSIGWGAGRLLAVLFIRLTWEPVAYAAEPSGMIPAIRAEVTGVKFFESGFNPVSLEQRLYNDQFFADSARYIHYELELSHPPPGRRAPVTVEEIWRDQAGAVALRHTRTFTVESHWRTTYPSGSARLVVGKTVTAYTGLDVFRCRGLLGEWGPCDATAQRGISFWPRGTYRVELFVDRQLVATGAFSMLSKRDYELKMLDRMGDESTPTGSIPPLRGRVEALRLFDAGPPIPPRKGRRYAERFAPGTRNIGWQLDITHTAPGRWLPLTIEAYWYRLQPGGRRLIQRRVVQAGVSSGWIDTQLSAEADHPGRNGWVAGTYRLELHLERRKVAATSFEVR